jgi:hypothetical protein
VAASFQERANRNIGNLKDSIMKKYALAAAVALSVSGLASAGEYQFEVNGLYNESEMGRVDIDTWGIGGTFYLEAVNDSKGPLAEAAFLNKASFINAGYSDTEIKSRGLGKVDGDAFVIGGEYVIPEGNFILGASYSNGDIDGLDIKSYGLTVGKYLNDNTSLRFNYINDDDDLSDTDTDTFELKLHHLTGDINNGMQIGVDASIGYADTDSRAGDYDAWAFGVGADLYLTRQFSLGAGVQVIAGDKEAKGDGYDLRAQYFFMPQFAVSLSYSELDLDSAPDDFEGWTIALTGRF